MTNLRRESCPLVGDFIKDRDEVFVIAMFSSSVREFRIHQECSRTTYPRDRDHELWLIAATSRG